MVRLGLGLDQGCNEPDTEIHKLPSALGTNPERLEYLYSIPQPGDVDDDFDSTWQRAVEECAAARGWLVLHRSDLETALAHDAFGPPPGLATCLAAKPSGTSSNSRTYSSAAGESTSSELWNTMLETTRMSSLRTSFGRLRV